MINFKKGFYADIRRENRFSTLISYRNGEAEQCREREEDRAFIRVFDGNMWFYASSTETDEKALQALLDGLYSAAKENADILNNETVKKFEVHKETRLIFNSRPVKDIPLKEKDALLNSYLPVLSEFSCAKLPGGAYVDRISTFSFVSSLGADIKYDYQTCGLRFDCSMVEGEKKFSAHWQTGKDEFAALYGLEGIIRASFAEQAEYMRTSVPVTPGKYPVVLSPEAAGVFAHESFGHKSEADFMLSDESMRKEWELGKAVGSPILSIVDCGSVPGCGYVPFDDEGTAAKKNYLIKDGILAGRLHSGLTAAALGENVTGNARAVNCTFEPIVRMTSTYIEAGNSTFAELIKPIKKGYFIKNIRHGSGMSTFTIAPSLAYEIEDGKITRPVQISVISGSVFETLGLIDGLGDKCEMLSFVMGGCGKMEQMRLPVGFGGPYVRVSKMDVQ